MLAKNFCLIHQPGRALNASKCIICIYLPKIWYILTLRFTLDSTLFQTKCVRLFEEPNKCLHSNQCENCAWLQAHLQKSLEMELHFH